MNYKKPTVLLTIAAFVLGLSVLGARRAQAASTWYVSPTGTPSGISGGSCTNPSFNTISAAVTAASAGDTIQACAGVYPELVQVTNTLTILGAQAGNDARTRATGSESIVGSGDGAFQIEADNVVIDGFTIQGVNNPGNLPPFTGLDAGIWTNPGATGTHGGHQIRNNIIQNNIIGIELDNDGSIQTTVERNLIQNNNANVNGPDNGTGIDTNFGLVNAVIDGNKFVGNSNSAIDAVNASASLTTYSYNEFDSNRRAIGLSFVKSSTITHNNIHDSNDSATADIRIFGGADTLSITCNNLQNGAGRGIRIDDECPGCPSMGISINNNNISGYPVAGLEVDSGGFAGNLDARNNWWGRSTGPTVTHNPVGPADIVDPDGVVMYIPFLTSRTLCAPCPNTNPGCTTNRKDCHKFVEDEEKNFNQQQEADKKAFDDNQKVAKKQFDSQPHTPAQRKAFEDQQKTEKKNFDDNQKTAKDAFQQQYKAQEQQCETLPK